MAFEVKRSGALEYLTSSLLAGAAHCFSTRFGGVSEGYLASLNLGTHRGDRPENVRENYAILGRAVGFLPERTVFTRQVHSDVIERVGAAQCGRGLQYEATEGCDGLITDEPGVALTVFSADCTPVLLYDPVRRAAGAVHAGWRGTAAGIAAKAAEKMVRELGCRPENIRAAVGPCIGPCCFETGAEVPAAAAALLGGGTDGLWHRKENGKYMVDLAGVVLRRLEQLGLRRENMEALGECTMCHPERYWSHRYTGGVRGSQANIIML